MFSVPLYFQITKGTSNTESGSHLVPAVVGNAVGGLLSGVVIKRCVALGVHWHIMSQKTGTNVETSRTGRYKLLVTLAVTCSSLSYLLLMLRWHGNTNWWESLYIIPGYVCPDLLQKYY